MTGMNKILYKELWTWLWMKQPAGKKDNHMFLTEFLPCARHQRSSQMSHLTCEVSKITPNLILRELQLIEIKSHTQGHSAGRWWNQASNPGLFYLTSKPQAFPPTLLSTHYGSTKDSPYCGFRSHSLSEDRLTQDKKRTYICS